MDMIKPWWEEVKCLMSIVLFFLITIARLFMMLSCVAFFSYMIGLGAITAAPWLVNVILASCVVWFLVKTFTDLGVIKWN